MAATPNRSVVDKAGRFVVAGLANTLMTAALLSLLSLWIDQRVAYTVVFVLGIALSTVLAGKFVFRAGLTRNRTIAYVLVYVGVYLVGLGVTTLMVRFGAPPWAAGLVVVVTAPLGFLGGSLVFRDRQEPEPPQAS
jgi:putative flippase GtrA